MYRNMLEAGLTEVIPLTGTSTISGISILLFSILNPLRVHSRESLQWWRAWQWAACLSPSEFSWACRLASWNVMAQWLQHPLLWQAKDLPDMTAKMFIHSNINWNYCLVDEKVSRTRSGSEEMRCFHSSLFRDQGLLRMEPTKLCFPGESTFCTRVHIPCPFVGLSGKWVVAESLWISKIHDHSLELESVVSFFRGL